MGGWNTGSSVLKPVIGGMNTASRSSFRRVSAGTVAFGRT